MRRTFVFLLVVLLVLAPLSALAASEEPAVDPGSGQALEYTDNYGLSRVDFSQMVSGGFLDRTNSYAWSMTSFEGDLYIGTGRYQTTFNPMWESIWAVLTPTTRPPQLPDVPQSPFLQDFLMRTPTAVIVKDEAAFQAWNSGSQTEIWRLHSGVWSRVYEAPQVPSYLRAMDGSMPYQVPTSMGLRSMATFTDLGGQSAIYAFTGGLTFARPDRAALIYSSTTGTEWSPVAVSPLMGRETRASTTHNGKLYVGVAVGPSVWCTDTITPTPGSWRKVLDFSTTDTTNTGVVSLASYNGKLYVGTENNTGFQVWASTVAEPTGNADFVKIVGDGAGDRYNAWAATMKEFKGDLYIGSIGFPFLSGYQDFKGFDLIRVYPDNSWDLLVGDRNPVAPPEGAPPRHPLSGWPSGFGNMMNFYCWSLEVYDDVLYLGTFDASVFLRYLPAYIGPLPPPLSGLTQEMIDLLMLGAGADLWKTKDGLSWSPVTLTGFGDPNNYGFRTLKAANGGLYLGTSNPFWGCQVWAAGTFHFPLTIQPGWNLLSLPLITDPNPNNVFDNLPGEWLLFQWDPILGRYLTREEITLAPGEAYWLLLRGLTQPLSYQIIGVPYSGETMQISLSPGWNAVGNPYLASIPWHRVLIKRMDSYYTLDSAASLGIVGSAAWAYDGTRYVNIKEEFGRFDASVSFWLQAKEPCLLVFPRP